MSNKAAATAHTADVAAIAHIIHATACDGYTEYPPSDPDRDTANRILQALPAMLREDSIRGLSLRVRLGLTWQPEPPSYHPRRRLVSGWESAPTDAPQDTPGPQDAPHGPARHP